MFLTDPECSTPARRGFRSIALQEVALEQQVVALRSPRLHRCNPGGTATETVRRPMIEAEPVTAGDEVEAEGVAGANTLPLDDPAAEVVDDDEAARIRDRAFGSPVVDVNHPNEVTLHRTPHDTGARTRTTPSGQSRVAAGASRGGESDGKKHWNDEERWLHLTKVRRRAEKTSHPDGRQLRWATFSPLRVLSPNPCNLVARTGFVRSGS